MQKTIKIKLIANHLEYKKGQIVELDEKAAIALLTISKALKIHRKKEARITEKPIDKTSKKSK